MPPPTPSATFIAVAQVYSSASAGSSVLVNRGVFVLHQAAAHFFHRHHGGLLGGRGQEAARAVLQLPRALGGDDDEAVGARFRIVRNHALRDLFQICFSHFSFLLRKRLQNRTDLVFHPVAPAAGGLHDRRPAYPPTPPPPDSPARNRTANNSESLPRHPAAAARSPLRSPGLRARSRCSRTCRLGARIKIDTAAGILSFNCRAPWTSMSSTRS